MAIVRMKRLRIIALASQREELLSRLLHAGCVELSEPQAELDDPQWTALLHRSESALADVRQELARVNTALQTLNRYAPGKKGLFTPRKAIREGEFLSSEALALSLERAGNILSLEREREAVLAQMARLTAKRAALQPWAALDADLGMTSTRNVEIAFMTCPAGVELETLASRLAAEAPDSQIAPASTDKELHYFLYLCHKSQSEAGAAVLKEFGGTPASLKGFSGTAIDNIAAVNRELEPLAARAGELEEEVRAMAGCRQDLEICVDRLRQEEAKQAAAQRSLTNGTIIFFTGWVTEPGLPAVRSELEKFSCAWEAEDPDPAEYPEVPVQLKNNWFTRPLNMVTDMYALPAYNGVDPNPLMAPFFIFFYGFMMADMGYGLLMMLASVIILKKAKPRGATMRHMIPLLGLCGVSTFIMGALTGGFFGDLIPQLVKLTTGREIALPALFSPLDDALAVLIGSLAIGVVQIFTGMGISMYRKIKRGDVMGALCDEGAWYAVFILFGAGAAMGRLKPALIAALVILVLTQGYGKKGVGGKLMGIAGSLYNHITGYFSDILSYSRLMALMLAGAVIAQVFNTLGGITGNVVAFFLISMVGNALNFALNLLGCYVHDMRLQCLEFFSRFYEDGGKPFRPLRFDTQYVDIVQE